MKTSQFDFVETNKIKITKKAQKEVKKLYQKVAEDFERELNNIPSDGMVSEQLRRVWLSNYLTSLNKEIDKLTVQLSKKIIANTEEMAQIVVDANISLMAQVGLELKGAFSWVPTQVVEALVSGSVYKGDWSFSEAIWGAGAKTKHDLSTIIAEGIAKQKPAYDIAKDLEKYVNPSAKKDWKWSKVYPSTAKKVDYNAQRLARTMIQHSYQVAYRQTIDKNPFVYGSIWHSVFAKGRTCQLCMDRDGQHYSKGKEPLDHPQGLCFLEPDMPSMGYISNELADWAHGKPNKAIDEYINYAYKGG